MSSSKEEEQLVPNIVINGYLECPVCLDFAVSPIYTCNNGHIVCGICEEKTKTCPTCQANNLIVNEFIERILKSEEVVFPCRNSTHGCSLKIKPSNMRDHLKSSCDFRPVKCTETGCEGKSYNPKDLFKHWVEDHKKLKGTCKKSTLGNDLNVIHTICGSRTLSKTGFNTMNLKPNEFVSWKTDYFELDSRIFFLHCRAQNKTIHQWITLLGEELDGELYHYSATINSDLSKSTKKVIQFHEIPIHSLQYHDLEKVDALGHTVAVKCNSLAMLQDKQPTDPTHVLKWNIKIEIYKIQDP